MFTQLNRFVITFMFTHLFERFAIIFLSLSSVMRGLIAQSGDMSNRYINADMSNKLFMSKEKVDRRSGKNELY